MNNSSNHSNNNGPPSPPDEEQFMDAPVSMMNHAPTSNNMYTDMEEQQHDDEEDSMTEPGTLTTGTTGSNTLGGFGQCRRYTTYRLVMIGMSLLVLMATGAVVGLSIRQSRRDSSSQQTQAPISSSASVEHPFDSLEQYYEYVLDTIELSNQDQDPTITNMNHWTDPNKAQFQAIQHLVYQDGAEGYFLVDRESIEQRLALLLLYFRTGGDLFWANQDWIRTASFECEWDFVDCEASVEISSLGGNTTTLQAVTHLRLQSQASMTNTLPTETFAWLPHLQYLDVSQNRLEGTIPWTLWNLKELQLLHLDANQFEGRLPTDLSTLSKLEDLWISDNFFDGPLPLYMPLESLKYFMGSVNSFTGSIPTTWWQAHTERNVTALNYTQDEEAGTTISTLAPIDYPLRQLLLAYNGDLDGTLPTELGLFTNLHYLSVKRCSMTGSVPTEFGQMTKLKELSLSDNRFSGQFPFEYVLKLPELQGLTLGDNYELSGTIPGDVIQNYTSQYQKLESWNMVYNSFSGTLPTELGLMTSLEWVQFSNNQFSGEIPTFHLEQGGWHNTVKTLWLQTNFNLVGTVPCGGNEFGASQPQNNDGRDYRADCKANANIECACCNWCQ